MFENMPQLQISEVVLIYSNIANNYYQQYLKVLYKFIKLY